MKRPHAAEGLWVSTATTALVAAMSPQLVDAQEVFELDPIIIEWENLGRPIEETSAANTVIDGATAEAPQNADVVDAVDGIPNVIVERGAELPVIRGIDGTAGQYGAAQFATGSNPRVNVVVDGVSRVSSVNGGIGTDASAWDVRQIEVARGPQTTLGGRSSLAGAINVVTNDPVFTREGALRFSYETRNDEPLFGLSGMYNMPLGEQAAVRLSFDGDYGDAFIDVVDPTVKSDRDEIEDISNGTFRAKALFAPEAVPGLEVVLSYEKERKDMLSQNEADIGSDDYELSDFATNASETRLDQDIFSIRTTYDISSAWTIEGRFSYQDLHTEIPDTNVNFNLAQDIWNTQAEVLARYQGDGFVRRAVLGFAYEQQDEYGLNDTLGAPSGFLFEAEGSVENRSVFGEVEVALTDTLFGFVGGRYERQEIERDVYLEFFSVAEESSRTEDSRFTPRIGLRYEPTEALTFGYQYSEGYRPGAVDVDVFSPVPVATTFDGETLRQHEVWTRYADPAGRFNLNAAAFFYTLEDAQVPGAGPGFLIGNLPEAEGYGLELSGDVALGEYGRLTAGIGLLETEVTDAGSEPETAGFSGEPLPNAAGRTFSLGYDYVAPSGWDFGIHAQHVAERNSFVGSPDLQDYTRVDLRGGYDADIGGQSVRFEAFVTNVFDEEIVVFEAAPTKELADPRTFGVSATMRF